VELEETIERFEQEQGRLDGVELRQALGIVERSTAGPDASGAMATRLALLAAIGLGFLVLGLTFARGGLAALGRTPFVMGLVLGLLAVGAVVAILAARK
jgi:hypothetical protein